MYNTTDNFAQNATALGGRLTGHPAVGNAGWSELQHVFWGLGEGRGRMHQLWAELESKLAPGVKFYLTVLLTIAAANSIFILVSFLDPDMRSCHPHQANSIHTKHCLMRMALPQCPQVQQGAF